MTRAKYTSPICSAVAIFVFLAACGSSAPEGSPAPGGEKAPPARGTATSPTTPPPPVPSSPGSVPLPAARDGGTAAKSPKTVCQGTKDLACFACCDQHYPATNKAFWGCFCDAAAGLCATECGKDYMCGGDQDLGAACYDCFDKNVATCDERNATARQSNQEMRDYEECTAACPATEPDPAP